MFAKQPSKGRAPAFESLESKRCPAVTAVVSNGDLKVSGAANGQVQIVAVSAGAYQVTDNGVVVADATTLTGVTRAIRVSLADAAGDNVVVNLGSQTIDAVYARLGDGDNSFQVTGGTAKSLTYRGGGGADSVQFDSAITRTASVTLGDGDNSVTVTGALGGLSVRGGDETDAVTIAATATVSGGVSAYLEGGDNKVTVAGSVDRSVDVSAEDGADSVVIADTAAIGRGVRLNLGDGDNTTDVAGHVNGSLSISGRDGNDAITIESTAVIADNFFARLGAGNNTVTQNGDVEGNFTVITANAADQVTIADGATIGGKQNLALGDQQDHGGGCHGGGREGSYNGGHEAIQAGGHFGEVAAHGRTLGFFFRGAR